jgi:Tol biopolymer transport system component
VRHLHVLGLAVAACMAMLLAACAGSDGGSADLLVVSTRDGDYAIYTMSAAGEGEKRLTDDAGDPSTPRGLFFQVEPAWSPDGRRIAFSSKREGSFDLYAMEADGTETRRLTATPADDHDPSWSPDGRRIVFSRGTPGDLYVMDADGSSVRRLAATPAHDTQPAWSPDGRWIVFTRKAPGTSIRELWLVRADGSGARQLTSLEAVSDAPAWSPDGTRVAFATNVDNVQFDVYSIAVTGGDRRRVTVTAEDSFEPAYSMDGASIAYSEGGAIYSKKVADDQYAEGERLTDAASNDSSPEWRPSTPSAG